MRILLLCLLGLCATAPVDAQTPSAMRNLAGSLAAPAAGRAANNPWLGSQVVYRFAGGDAGAENLLVAGNLLYEIPLSMQGLHLPVRGNVSAVTQGVAADTPAEALDEQVQQLLFSNQGLHVGLFPYFEHAISGDVLLTYHGAAAWKLNGFKDDAGGISYIQQGRFALGVDALIGSRSGGRAGLSLSVAPTLTVFGEGPYEDVFGEAKGSLTSLEFAAIVPVGLGVGFMLDGVIGEDSSTAVRAGLAVSVEGR